MDSEFFQNPFAVCGDDLFFSLYLICMVIYITRFPPIEHNFLFSWYETYVGSPTGDVSRVISDVGVEPGMSPLSSTAALGHY